MAEAPRRVQLRRTKGWKMPPNTVKVDRSTPWGNPFIPGKSGGAYTGGRLVQDQRHAWRLYQAIAPLNPEFVAKAKAELRGKNLACWCRHDDPYQDICHAAVLLEIANGRSYRDQLVRPHLHPRGPANSGTSAPSLNTEDPMSEKHTPGPWSAVDETDPRSQPVPYYRGLVCLVQKGPEGTLAVVTGGRECSASEWRANALLIAAAPEMLEALKHLTSTFESFAEIAAKANYGNADVAREALEAVAKLGRAAITRATGR